jgi:SAM-dependent methyltransferase
VNLSEDELEAWLEDEREGYANLGYEATNPNEGYEYAEAARSTGWRHLPDRRWRHAVGIGSAEGTEFEPIKDRVDAITIVEPSAQLRATKVGDVELVYVDPSADGSLPFEDDSFDLAICFGVLHHIAKVSRVLSEIARCIEPGGYLLLREPIVSMGDWRTPRAGITARERGIPLDVFRQMIDDTGLEVKRETFCVFTLVGRLRFLGPHGPYSSGV